MITRIGAGSVLPALSQSAIEVKQMPRLPRVIAEGGVFRVYNRFVREERILEDQHEAERLLRLIGEVEARDGLVVLGWSLLRMEGRTWH